MKKVIFVLSFCLAIVIANAQTQTTAPAMKTGSAVQKANKPGTPVKEADLLKPIKDNLASDFKGAKFVKAIKMDKNGVEF